MAANDLAGVPQRRPSRHKPSGTRSVHVHNQLTRDFTINEPNNKRVVDITYKQIQIEYRSLNNPEAHERTIRPHAFSKQDRDGTFARTSTEQRDFVTSTSVG